MSNERTIVSLHHEASDCHFPDMIGCVLVTNMKSLGDVVDRKFGVALQELHNLESTVIGKAFHYPLHIAICHRSHIKSVYPLQHFAKC